MMMMTLTHAERMCGNITGRLALFETRQDGTGSRTLLVCKNTVVKTGADIVASAVVGGGKRVNGLYLHFTNNAGTVPPQTVPITRTSAFYHSLPAGEGIVRVPALAAAAFAASEDGYEGNEVSLVGITGSEVIGATLTDSVSRFIGAALVYLDPTSYLNDKLFSGAYFLVGGVAVPALKQPNAQFGVRWIITTIVPT